MDLPERLPAPLSERLASSGGSIFQRFGREVDVAIGGIPFRLATYPEAPRSIETIEVRKEQVDVERDPGEQSLSGWWRRSQASFHEGAGFLYQEDSEELVAANGFYDSEGVDVFTKGQFTLLKRMVQNEGSAVTPFGKVRTYSVNGTRTNLCTNPSIEADTIGWSVNGGTFSRVSTVASSGAWSLRVDFDGAGGSLDGWVTVPDVGGGTPGTPIRASVRVWIPEACTVDFVLQGNFISGTSTAGKLRNSWVTLTLDTTVTSGGDYQVVLVPTTPPDAADFIYVDDALIEEGNVLGAYFDGDSTDATWTGTAGLSTSILTITSSGVNLSAIGDGALYTAEGVDGAMTVLHDPAPTLVDGLISGLNFYSVASDGTLYAGLISSPGTATSWPMGGIPARMMWAKHRLWVLGGRRLWQPDVNLSGGTAQNPIFTNPNQGWNYTCMAEGPAAVYFGGHDGFTSSIQAVTLDSGGGLPTLSGASVSAALPNGELVQEIASLAGSLLGIGTNRGFRVGRLTTDGGLTYGPLLIEPEGVNGCTALTTQGRFFLVGFRTEDGSAMAYRVDTGTELDDFVFPYAKDIDCGLTGGLTSMVGLDKQIVATASDGSLWYQSATDYVDTGFLQSGRIRYRTTEPKNFKYLEVEIQPLEGQIQLSVIAEGGGEVAVGNITKQGAVADSKFGINAPPMRYGSVKITLVPSDDLQDTPVVNSYLLKSLPATPPQRMITLPLLCFDKEQGRTGQKYGSNGFGAARVAAMQALEDLGEVLSFQDFTGEMSTGRLVVIDSMQYLQTVDARTTDVDGPGGILIVKLRTAD